MSAAAAGPGKTVRGPELVLRSPRLPMKTGNPLLVRAAGLEAGQVSVADALAYVLMPAHAS